MKTKMILALLAALCGISAGAVSLGDINMRDPFIYTDTVTDTYYLYGSTLWRGEHRGIVEAYTSRDLVDWEGPHRVLTVPDDNWATGVVWAPEMHAYNGRYYILATPNDHAVWKNSDDPGNYTYRGTQIFHADHPLGPFEPFPSRLPATPMGQMCLDGTLWVEDSIPYIVYCHEWIETVDGEICLQRLSTDLSEPVGLPMRLFCASAAPWSDGSIISDGHKNYVTDGPFLYRSPVSGDLYMLWSSFLDGDYAIGYARSATGRITGPWHQVPEPLFRRDGGHGMLFHALDGRLYLVIHTPNGPDGAERPRLIPITDTGHGLTVAP